MNEYIWFLFGLVLGGLGGSFVPLIQLQMKASAIKKILANEKPSVAFPFEQLTELVDDCAKKFAAYPLVFTPQAFISPAQFFNRGATQFFHPPTSIIYFKDNFVNKASPKELADTVMAGLITAWLFQHRNEIFIRNNISPEAYDAAVASTRRILGLETVMMGLPQGGAGPANPAKLG